MQASTQTTLSVIGPVQSVNNENVINIAGMVDEQGHSPKRESGYRRYAKHDRKHGSGGGSCDQHCRADYFGQSK